MTMSPAQKKQMEDAKRESEEKTYNVCANGEKNKSEYDQFSNQINDE